MRYIILFAVGLTLSSSISAQERTDSVRESLAVPAIDQPLIPAFRAMPDSGVVKTIASFISEDDDRYYFHPAPWYLPLIKITVSNAALWAVDRYVFNYDF